MLALQSINTRWDWSYCYTKAWGLVIFITRNPWNERVLFCFMGSCYYTSSAWVAMINSSIEIYHLLFLNKVAIDGSVYPGLITYYYTHSTFFTVPSHFNSCSAITTWIHTLSSLIVQLRRCCYYYTRRVNGWQIGTSSRTGQTARTERGRERNRINRRKGWYKIAGYSIWWRCSIGILVGIHINVTH